MERGKRRKHCMGYEIDRGSRVSSEDANEYTVADGVSRNLWEGMINGPLVG